MLNYVEINPKVCPTQTTEDKRQHLLVEGKRVSGTPWGAKAKGSVLAKKLRGFELQAYTRLKQLDLGAVLAERRAQGTTEYAILVGVLVVIAIVAIVAFKDKIQELWTAIQENINSL